VTVSDAIAQTEGLPRANGELVFAEPWEARAFGVAVALCGERGLDWEEFRGRLIAEIDGWERANGVESDGWSYYERWLAALESLLEARGVAADEEIDARMALLAATPEH